MSNPPDPSHRRSNDETSDEVTADAEKHHVPTLDVSPVVTGRIISGALAGLLVIALVACAWFGWKGTEDEEPSTAAQSSMSRDSAIQAAEDGLLAFHTIDYRHIDDVLATWRDLSTGQLRTMVEKGRKAVGADVKKSRTVSSAKIVRLGLTTFDDDAGEARVVALVAITTQTKGAGKTTTNHEFLSLLDRGKQGWKMSAMQDLGGAS